MSHPTFTTRFPHQRLEVYRLALELFRLVEELADGFPNGYADLKDQLRRATAATVRHIAEGANRIHPKDKAARFIVARAECGESEATLEMAQIVGVVCAERAQALRVRADRIGAMLLGLIRRERGRASASA